LRLDLIISFKSAIQVNGKGQNGEVGELDILNPFTSSCFLRILWKNFDYILFC